MSGATGRAWQRMMNLIAPGKITGTDDSGTVLKAQARIGSLQTLDGVPVVQQYGFSSTPPAGSDVIIACLGGDRANAVALGTNDQATRPSGKAAGETAMYNGFGHAIHLSATGITINPGATPVLVNGDLHATGAIVQRAGPGGTGGIGTGGSGGGGTGSTGGAGQALASTFVYAQNPAAAVWTIAHGLGTFPSVAVADTAGNAIEGAIAYSDLNTLTLTFSVPLAGTAYLS